MFIHASRRARTMAGIALAGLTGMGAAAAVGTAEEGAYTVRQEIDRSFQLQPGARIEIAAVAGPVTVETGPGNRAEVHVVNLAHSQRELDCSRVEVQGGPQGVKLRRVEPARRDDCRNVQARQEVRLRVPRAIALSLSGVAGSVDVGMVDGPVSLHGIAGHASVAGARSADVSGMAGRLSLSLGALDSRGVRISGVSGSVDLALRPGTNADVEISSVVGPVRSESPALRLVQRDHGYGARLGSGGPRLTISSVVGAVRLKIS